ncbi:MAG: glycosyltransferase [Candidatus Omnitrophica bacterium]|nr:glycosyltransferase [Candidatus Omnitrophota bacterium]
MKVLHLLYQSLPDVRGASIRSHQILKYQKKTGIDVIPVTSPFQEPAYPGARMDEIDGVAYYRTYLKGDYEFAKTKKRLRKRLRKILPIIHYYREAKNYLVNNDIDVIHAHSVFFCGLTGLLLSKRFGIPLVYEVRSNWISGMIENGAFKERSPISKVYTFFENLVIRKANEVVIIGENLREYIRDAGRKNTDSLTVVYNCVDLEETKRLSCGFEQKERSLGKIVFGFIGNLYRYEGLDDLIKVFLRVKAEYPNVSLMIVGGGEEMEGLKKAAKGNEGIVFTGKVTRGEIAKYYREIDVIILPRKDLKVTNQVTPLKPLEAMGFKKAILASDVAGICEIIKGENGILFKAGSYDDLYNKMEQLIDNPDLIESLGENGFTWVSENRNWDVEILKYKKLYERLLKQGS